jgi:serine/threonine protein kinase
MFSFLRSGVKKDYDIEKKILGEGKFATVRRASNRQTGQLVAVKTIFKDRIKKNKVCGQEICCFGHVGHLRFFSTGRNPGK